MPTYRVTWEIDVEAESPAGAAMEAYAAMRDEDSTATCFHVVREAGQQGCFVDLDFENGVARVRDLQTSEVKLDPL